MESRILLRSISKKFDANEYLDALDNFGLKGRELQIARTLSTGQKRRLSFAALKLLKPNLIFADEPTNGLDTKGIELCINLFEELRTKYQSSIIVASHDLQLISWAQKNISLENYLAKKSDKKTSIRKLF